MRTQEERQVFHSILYSFSSSAKLSQVFQSIMDRKIENMLFILFKNFGSYNNNKKLVYLDHQNANFLCLYLIITLTAYASSVFLNQVIETQF